MHIPDGFLDTKTVVATATLSAVGVTMALRSLNAERRSRQIPLLGLAGAFVFTAQMLNFPVAGGTSGHLIGAVLASVLLGPSAAVIVITSVLFVQCFLFADGGVLALGANIFNMALVAPLCGYAIYSVIHKMIPGMRGTIIAASFASWCSVLLASVCCTGELALSGTVPWATAFLAMTSVHALIGVGEGIITGLVIVAVNATRPELLENNAPNHKTVDYKLFLSYGLILTAGLLIFVAPFASPLPDGLEYVSKLLGFEHRAVAQPAVSMPFSSYRFPGISNAVMSTVAAGICGMIIVFILSVVLAYVVIPNSQKNHR